MEKIKKMFSSKSSRNGTYSVGLAVIVIAIAIVINLVAGQLPEKGSQDRPHGADTASFFITWARSLSNHLSLPTYEIRYYT